MSVQLITSFLFYCFISGITPGPANLTSLYSGLNFGKGPALRQWRGLFTGYFVDAMIAVLVNYFIGSALGDYVKYLGWIGAAYIIWMAIHILLSSTSQKETDVEQCSFKRGFFLQLTNVKVIIFCITALSSYVLPVTHTWWVLLLVGCFLPFTGPMCNLVWLFAGVKLQKLFEKHRRVINILMAAALVLCAISLMTL